MEQVNNFKQALKIMDFIANVFLIVAFVGVIFFSAGASEYSFFITIPLFMLSVLIKFLAFGLFWCLIAIAENTAPIKLRHKAKSNESNKTNGRSKIKGPLQANGLRA